jgi:hypothetical protein
MGCPEDRKALAVELFTVTGEAVPEDDPIVTGALFFSYKLGESGRLVEAAIREAASLAVAEIREAGRLAAKDIREAGRQIVLDNGEAMTASEKAMRSTAGALEKMSADRSQLLKAVEAQIVKGMKQVNKGAAVSQNVSHIPVRYAIFSALAAAVVLTAAVTVGIERGSAQAEEAAIGRAFSRVVPELDPKVREHIMVHLEKKAK